METHLRSQWHPKFYNYNICWHFDKKKGYNYDGSSKILHVRLKMTSSSQSVSRLVPTKSLQFVIVLAFLTKDIPIYKKSKTSIQHVDSISTTFTTTSTLGMHKSFMYHACLLMWILYVQNTFKGMPLEVSTINVYYTC